MSTCNVIVYGGPLIPARGAWLGLKCLPDDMEEQRRDRCRFVFICDALAFPLVVGVFGDGITHDVLSAVRSAQWPTMIACTCYGAMYLFTFLAFALCATGKWQRQERFLLYVTCFLVGAVQPFILSMTDPVSCREVWARRCVAHIIFAASQFIVFQQVSIGVLALPFIGHIFYAARCLLVATASSQANGLYLAMQHFFVQVYAIVAIVAGSAWLLHIIFIKPHHGRRTQFAHLGVDFGSSVFGLQRWRDLESPWDEDITDVESDYTNSSSSTPREEHHARSSLPSRQSAKEALIALYVLSRSAWGPDGQALPLSVHKRMAECLGRHHLEKCWRERRQRMETFGHEEWSALLDAIFEGDGNQSERESLHSYCSSVGSLTAIWHNLFSWFSK
eukprot:TRINITY_DN27051_c0_g1_i1.p1 TRINITY_DN27051_c0_g1~~TRINITY_DN27051_c0_g1_i1.p1  ORF type:complete len:390 (+),score=29.19 TRINITY_DN27051_c0_g1_i1:80-1249(+)